MADTSGEQDIRGIDIDKLAKGFADIDNIFKKFANNSATKAREMRWFQKTSGFLDTTATTVIPGTHISNTSEGSLPFVTEQSWTRQTSYVKCPARPGYATQFPELLALRSLPAIHSSAPFYPAFGSNPTSPKLPSPQEQSLR